LCREEARPDGFAQRKELLVRFNRREKVLKVVFDRCSSAEFA
jgi:hypothetical protein